VPFSKPARRVVSHDTTRRAGRGSVPAARTCCDWATLMVLVAVGVALIGKFIR